MHNFTLNPNILEDPIYLDLPASWVGHIPFAFWLVENHKPQIVVELGAHSGNSYFSFCQAVNSLSLKTQCYAIDSWEGDEHAGEYDGDKIFYKVNSHNEKLYSGFSSLKRMYFNDAVSEFENGSIDILHIDGLHTYEAVKNDYDTWLSKISDRGIILFHDVTVREKDFGVWRLWDEVKNSYQSFLFDHCNGLGVLVVGKSVPSDFLASLLDHEVVAKKLFESLGARLIDKAVNYEAVISKYEKFAQARDKEILDLNGYISELNANSSKQINYRDELVAQLKDQIHDLEGSLERLTKNPLLALKAWLLRK